MKKLNRDDQGRVRAYLQNLGNLYGVHILVRVCGYCSLYMGVKDGQGVSGISHGVCPTCLEKLKREMKGGVKNVE